MKKTIYFTLSIIFLVLGCLSFLMLIPIREGFDVGVFVGWGASALSYLYAVFGAAVFLLIAAWFYQRYRKAQ